VALIRLGQPGMAPAERERVQRTYRGYAGLAETYARPAQPAMLLTHGVSGSGKTTASGRLLEQLGAVRIRSDVERKRLFGLAATARSGSPRAGGLYTRAGTEQTYQRLLELAERVVRSGFTVIVDATFLERAHRAQFRLLAQRLHTPFAILSCHAEPDTLRRWVSERQSKQQDASEAGTEVVEQQLQAQEPLDASEGPLAIRVDSAELMGGEALAIRVRRTLQGQV
jgi:predicted kinase